MKQKIKTNNIRYKLILEAAAKIFREMGYHHSTVSDIAKAVGLQKGSLYYHIDSKEELLYEIVMSALNLNIGTLKQIRASTKPPDALITEAIISHMDPLDAQFDIIYVFLNEFQNLSEKYKKEVSKEIEDYEKLWMDIIEQGKNEGLGTQGGFGQ